MAMVISRINVLAVMRILEKMTMCLLVTSAIPVHQDCLLRTVNYTCAWANTVEVSALFQDEYRQFILTNATNVVEVE